MPKIVRVSLTIDPSRVDEFIQIINEDKETAMQSPGITSFDVTQKQNQFVIEQSYSSNTNILAHHKDAHYRWSRFARSGGVLKLEHKFI